LLRKRGIMQSYEIVECEVCDSRFLQWDDEEMIVCKYCNNKDISQTYCLTKKEFARCKCEECEEMKSEIIERIKND